SELENEIKYGISTEIGVLPKNKTLEYDVEYKSYDIELTTKYLKDMTEEKLVDSENLISILEEYNFELYDQKENVDLAKEIYNEGNTFYDNESYEKAIDKYSEARNILSSTNSNLQEILDKFNKLESELSNLESRMGGLRGLSETLQNEFNENFTDVVERIDSLDKEVENYVSEVVNYLEKPDLESAEETIKEGNSLIDSEKESVEYKLQIYVEDLIDRVNKEIDNNQTLMGGMDEFSYREINNNIEKSEEYITSTRTRLKNEEYTAALYEVKEAEDYINKASEELDSQLSGIIKSKYEDYMKITNNLISNITEYDNNYNSLETALDKTYNPDSNPKYVYNPEELDRFDHDNFEGKEEIVKESKNKVIEYYDDNDYRVMINEINDYQEEFNTMESQIDGELKSINNILSSLEESARNNINIAETKVSGLEKDTEDMGENVNLRSCKSDLEDAESSFEDESYIDAISYASDSIKEVQEVRDKVGYTEDMTVDNDEKEDGESGGNGNLRIIIIVGIIIGIGVLLLVLHRVKKKKEEENGEGDDDDILGPIYDDDDEEGF
ncbi:MAG: hypothetical protein ACOCP8_07805, partial [archaeon]